MNMNTSTTTTTKTSSVVIPDSIVSDLPRNRQQQHQGAPEQLAASDDTVAHGIIRKSPQLTDARRNMENNLLKNMSDPIWLRIRRHATGKRPDGLYDYLVSYNPDQNNITPLPPPPHPTPSSIIVLTILFFIRFPLYSPLFLHLFSFYSFTHFYLYLYLRRHSPGAG